MGSIAFTVTLDSILYSILFHDIRSTSQDVTFICENTGSVYVHKLHYSECKIRVCYLDDKAIYTGQLQVDGNPSLVFVCENGNVVFGLAVNSGLCWHFSSIECLPLSCLAVEDSLIVTDGIHSFILYFNKAMEKCCFKLSFVGIHKVYINEGYVIFISYNGKKYRKTLEELKLNMCSLSSVNSMDYLTVNQAVSGIINCSSLMKSECKKISTLDLYLKQIKIYQQILFHSLDSSSEVIYNNGNYSLLLTLTSKVQFTDFEGSWWQIAVSVTQNEICTVNVFCDINECNFSDQGQFLVPFKLPKNFKVPFKVTMKCYLTLLSYNNSKPACTILLCEKHLDILDFLSEYNSFFISNFNFKPLKNYFIEDANIKEYVKSFNSSSAQNFIFSLLNMKPDLCVVKLWFMSQNLLFRFNCTKDYILLEIHCKSHILAVAVRRAVERRLSLLNQSLSNKVLLSMTVLSKAVACRQLLEYEINKSSPECNRYIYDVTTQLLSFIPT